MKATTPGMKLMDTLAENAGAMISSQKRLLNGHAEGKKKPLCAISRHTLAQTDKDGKTRGA